MTERLHFHFSLSCIGEGNGNPLQCSCLENPRDGGAWWAAVNGVTQSRTRLKRLSSSSSSNTNRKEKPISPRGCLGCDLGRANTGDGESAEGDRRELFLHEFRWHHLSRYGRQPQGPCHSSDGGVERSLSLLEAEWAWPLLCQIEHGGRDI